MILERLQLHHFRNYDELDIGFSPGINQIIGENGSGKTNLLESIYCLGLVKSFRTVKDADLVQLHQSFFQITGEFVNELSVRHTITIYYANGHKAVSLDGKKVSRHSAIIGFLPIVLFNPEDHRITSGSPSERRRFLDILLSQSDKSYLASLQEYHAILKQRNKLLCRIAEGQAGPSELDIWDLSFAKTATQIIALRLKFLHEIADSFAEAYQQISNEKQSLKAIYLTQDERCLEGEEAFLNCLRLQRKKEMLLQKTMIGPHRDDLKFVLDGRDVRKHASRGEQKSVLLALKFIEYTYLKSRTETHPILLLDDVYSELDEQRQKNLFMHLTQIGQVFITATQQHPLPATHHQSYHVRNGNVVQL
ncbi:MAG: DNA replication/repair protein RecF [Calditrichaeota bacterium]|nr:MAG: DNA replication/repair protein RecF [Calditrichota bacterium]